jgi:COMM domain containing 4
MKFKFCGDTDCPEWVLSEVALLNKISAIKLRLIIIQVINKLLKKAYDSKKISKFFTDSGLDEHESHTTLAVRMKEL